MIRKYVEIFCWKNVSSFCNAKATHIFSAKSIRILYIESAKTVNEMTLNELVKLTKLWTTGPWSILFATHPATRWDISRSKIDVFQTSGSRPLWLSWMCIQLVIRRFRVHSQLGWAIFFFMLIDHEKCLRSFSPFPLFKKGSCQFLAKECTLILVNSLEDKACPWKAWLCKLTALDMTLMGWLGRKTSTQTNKQTSGWIW